MRFPASTLTILVLTFAACTAESGDPYSESVSDSGDTGDNNDTAPVAENNAEFVSQSIPSSATAGDSVVGTVTMRNTGSATWSLSDGYYLGSEGPQDNFVWGTNRTFMAEDASVAPGEEYSFEINVVAPAEAGTYTMQWRMLQDAVEWFGATSDTVSVSVEVGAHPWETVTEEQLRAWRGSIATTLAPTACGPRPYEDNNPVLPLSTIPLVGTPTIARSPEMPNTPTGTPTGPWGP